MKKNVIIVAGALLLALLLGCVFYVADRLGDSTVKIAPTPTGRPEVSAEPTEEEEPSAVPTAVSSTPTPMPTETATPTETPEPTAEVSGTVTEAPTPTSEPSGSLSVEQAKELLSRISADELLLPQDIESYDLDVDSWTTMVRGNECYCINVLNPTGGLAGMFYIALDGSKGYRLNEDGDFIEIALP